MARIGESGDLLKCSFCGKSQKQVKKLIAGPGVYICDECIDLCNEIIEEELSEAVESPVGGVPGYMVAVKTSKEAKGEGADELKREALVMVQVTGHPNLVALIGVVRAKLVSEFLSALGKTEDAREIPASRFLV